MTDDRERILTTSERDYFEADPVYVGPGRKESFRGCASRLNLLSGASMLNAAVVPVSVKDAVHDLRSQQLHGRPAISKSVAWWIRQAVIGDRAFRPDQRALHEYELPPPRDVVDDDTNPKWRRGG